MRTETFQPEKTPAPVPAPRRRGKPSKWMGSADEVVAYLERREVEKDGWWRTLSAAIALLKHASQTIEKQEGRIAALEDLATRDELTGLANRRGFRDAFARELDRVKRGQSQGGLLVMIDLDNFKAINDTYGHAAGDQALRVLAKALERDIRVMDMAARLGGDEFVLMLANSTRKGALERAQTLIRQLNSLSLVWYGAEIPVRASLGLKEYKAGDTADSILHAADDHLYASKRAGKGITGGLKQEATGGL